MEILSVDEILEATQGKLLSGRADAEIRNISIDSRQIGKGELFVPIIGEHFDGHNFLGDVFIKKAKGILVSRVNKQLEAILARNDSEFVVIEVADTLKGLQDIAGYYRRKMQVRVIGITGSNGKTTTKEIIKALSNTTFRTFATVKNLNNHIGVPLNLLHLSENDQVAILEMGMNASGEIDRLADLVKPDIAVITNVSSSHIEFFDSVDDIAKAKAEIIRHLPSEGTLILNQDDKHVIQMRDLFEGDVITFGFSDEADIKAENVEMTDKYLRFDIVIFKEKRLEGIKLAILGKHNIYNALASVAAVFCIGVPMEDIYEGFKNICFPKNRLEIKRIGKIKLINDAYNANPASVSALIDTVDNMQVKGQKILILGEMKELGICSEKEHIAVGKIVANSSIDILFGIGEATQSAVKTAIENGMSSSVASFCDTKQKLYEQLTSFLNDENLIVLKGSRANQLEKVEEVLTAKLNANNLRGVLV